MATNELPQHGPPWCAAWEHDGGRTLSGDGLFIDSCDIDGSCGGSECWGRCALLDIRNRVIPERYSAPSALPSDVTQCPHGYARGNPCPHCDHEGDWHDEPHRDCPQCQEAA